MLAIITAAHTSTPARIKAIALFRFFISNNSFFHVRRAAPGLKCHIGLNTDTKIPELRTVFISGDFATVKAGTNQVSYREESSASVWNASSVTKKRFLAITLADAGDIPAAIEAVAKVFKTAETAVQSVAK